MKTVHNELVRPRQEIIDAFVAMTREYSPSCLVADSTARVGVIGGLRPVKREHKIAGPALTVQLQADELVDCLPVLGTAKPGDIIVVACQRSPRLAMWGGLMSTLSQMAGIAGAVIDGMVRDVDEVRDLDFPVWYHGTLPRRCPAITHDGTEPLQTNVPVVIEGQVIEPGDIIVADENGLGIVSPSVAQTVLDDTRELLGRENVIRDKIIAGATLHELLAEFGAL
ncbi:RraA family protein [Amycolatopsis sp. NPDC059657]|uniref:RraA family protein n=1 Tax=Amycolatopsis sp. NPDC059657 TaxID=3346899 RepID=UPI00367150D3